MENPYVATIRQAIEAELEKPKTDYNRINALFTMLDSRMTELGICEVAA